MLSAEQVAGPRTPGKASGDIRHHGSQPGHVKLADRKVRVKRPRLRHKTEGEVKIPAYQALRQDRGLSQHMPGALLRGVSAREYQEVLPQMAATLGVSPSAISRQAIEASVERRTHKVTRWRDVDMVQRWVASAWLLTEKHFRRINGHGNLWALAAILGRQVESTNQTSTEKVA